MERPYSIFLFEDNTVLRESIQALISLNDRYKIVGCFEHALDIAKQVDLQQPDIILMDIDMPGKTGIEALKEIRAKYPLIPVIMLTVFDDNINVLEAIYAGATGYLLKKHISTKLFQSIDEALTGGAPMSPSVARMVVSAMHKHPSSPNSYSLTQRETDILKSLSKGNSYKLMAAELSISIDTVRSHIKNIYEKLHVHSQTEAVSKAINEKLV